MFADAQIEPVLAHYGADCQPTQIALLGPGTGFSGALIWQLTAPRGLLALRRWPSEHPDSERLRFIHDVLWHVALRGIDFVPAPIRTRRGAGFVESDGHRWELAPWLPGAADYFPARLPEKLSAALAALAKFHLASADFPMAHGAAQSPGMAKRLAQLESLRGGGLQRILDKVTSSATGRGGELAGWAELGSLASHTAGLFATVAPAVAQRLAAVRRLPVPMKPCLRDIWSDHVLFDGSRVSGLIDFGAMRIETVAGDVVRLLGSMAGDDPAAWQLGLAAYQIVRPLSADELALVAAFDQSATLLSPWNWFQWVFADRRTFADPAVVTSRVRQIVSRLEFLSSNISKEPRTR
jgi:homoserine kinase type II